MIDFDFRNIAPRLGGSHEAFEELCCQLARREIPSGAIFKRINGAGGDGGVECYADLPDGTRIGWQAKYVTDVDSLLRQASLSLETALKIHHNLTKFIVCFPFNLTGPTVRRGRSGQKKFDDWQKGYVEKEASRGKHLIVEPWNESELRTLLLKHDINGGIREFFFNQTVFSMEWFDLHLKNAILAAGPRYTANPNVETDLWNWFEAFGRTKTWQESLNKKIRACRVKHNHLSSAVRNSVSQLSMPKWPENLHSDTESFLNAMSQLLDSCGSLVSSRDSQAYREYCSRLADLISELRAIEMHLAEDLDARYGSGSADSQGFRQYMAGYQISFPAANLDVVRETKETYEQLSVWLNSAECSLAFDNTFVLTGIAGSGKTHGICDTSLKRFKNGLLTCIAFGNDFRGEPDPGTRLVERLGLPMTLGINGLLDALNVAAETTGLPLIICIDAINETRPLRYWREKLVPFANEIEHRSHLRLCVTCRTSFNAYCLPEGEPFRLLEFTGFSGIENEACIDFFRYYGLEPPIAPILQPEFSNPLYLKLLCETLRDSGQHSLPSGWIGLAPTIRAFISEKERQFSNDNEISTGANIVGGSLRIIAREIAESGEIAIVRSRAEHVICQVRPQARSIPIIDWLIKADLLMEDGAVTSDPLGDECLVRPSFERLGDFLIADELLRGMASVQLDEACDAVRRLGPYLANRDIIISNSGIVSALSILIPENFIGRELPDLLEETEVRNEAIKITLGSLSFRDFGTFSANTISLINEALRITDYSYKTMDVLISISWQQSMIDAYWLDGLLRSKPLSIRDAYWCSYLHSSYETASPVRRVIRAAFDSSIEHVRKEIAERWAIMLLWFTAAADRRIKDQATRAVTSILAARIEIIPNILNQMLENDDDEVRERTLLSCYCAMILRPDTVIMNASVNLLYDRFHNNPSAFDNALIRDHIRCIAELASELGALPDRIDAEFTMSPIGSNWPLEIPSEEEIDNWNGLPKLVESCINDDFFHYSMGCLDPWVHSMCKIEMSRWIIRRVAAEFAYQGSGCEQYDRNMLRKYGPGRAKFTWAERIGKKYQWIALYQLASRLYDNMERSRSSMDPATRCNPLILLEERKIDPTLPPTIENRINKGEAWWIGATIDFRIGEHLPDVDWVSYKHDIPKLDNLLTIRRWGGQPWMLLSSEMSWNKSDNEGNSQEPYRYIRIQIRSYLIRKMDMPAACRSLSTRNFYGEWLPNGARWLYGFMGEYPWATSFNTEPDEWYGWECQIEGLPMKFIPTHNHLSIEWEYDATLGQNLYVLLPARTFFQSHDLWWDGRDGYCIRGGKTVFRDPSINDGEPSSLIADADDIIRRIDAQKLCLLFTMQGEKLIIGGNRSIPAPRSSFSQIASLSNTGSWYIDELVIFENYNDCTGPLLI